MRCSLGLAGLGQLLPSDDDDDDGGCGTWVCQDRVTAAYSRRPIASFLFFHSVVGQCIRTVLG